MGPVYVLGDLYNSLFTIQTSNPEIAVEYKIWNQIKAGLPPNYTIPDPNMNLMIKHLSQC